MPEPVQSESVIEVSEHDLPLHCPMPRTPVWCYHPRVFLDVAEAGEILCPYCSTRYIYRGAKPKGH